MTRPCLFDPGKLETITSPSSSKLAMYEPWQLPSESLVCAVPGEPLGVGGELLANLFQQQQQSCNQSLELGQTDLDNSWEDFQDLSDWCMTNPQQPRCDFRAGESTMAAMSTDARIDGSNVLTAAERTTEDLIQTLGRKATLSNSGDATLSLRNSTAYAVQPLHDHAYPVIGRQPEHQQYSYFNQNHNDNNNNNNNNNNGNSLNAKMIASSNNEVNDSRDRQIDNSSMAWQGPSSFAAQPTTSVPVNQDTLMNIEPKQEQEPVQDMFQVDEFDLLSYLCEDDTLSPTNSVSTDSSRVTDVNGIIPPYSSSHLLVSPKTCEPVSPITATETSSQQTTNSPHGSSKYSLSSTSSEVTIASRSSSSGRPLKSMIKLEEPDSPVERRAVRTRRSRASSTTSRSSLKGRGIKRINDSSDSDDDLYRETREKNNEASRKSRMNKKAKEMEMTSLQVELEKENRILKMKADELEKLVAAMREAMLRSATLGFQNRAPK